MDSWVGDLDRFLGWVTYRVSWVGDLNGFLGWVTWMDFLGG